MVRRHYFSTAVTFSSRNTTSSIDDDDHGQLFRDTDLDQDRRRVYSSDRASSTTALHSLYTNTLAAMNRSNVLALLTLLIASTLTDAFVPTFTRASSLTCSRTTLQEGFLNDLLSGVMGNKSNGPETIMQIPARDLKIGALRFLLQIYLVGEQNKPVPKSWFTKQGEQPGELQVYYGDGTGMVSIELEDYGIKFVRHGEKPSLQYRLQESVLLHGVLDELTKVSLEMSDIEEEKRLLRLDDSAAIDKARDALPARPSSTGS
jgi:hypothetical protein